MVRSLIGFVLLGVAVGSSGCDSSLVQVTGQVTLDGKDLPDGEIIFVPEDPTQAPDAGKISNGKFDVLVKPGNKKVEIRASRELPPIKDEAMGEAGVPRFESIIPQQYNDKTQLTLEVPPTGVSNKLFELQGMKGQPASPREP